MANLELGAPLCTNHQAVRSLEYSFLSPSLKSWFYNSDSCFPDGLILEGRGYNHCNHKWGNLSTSIQGYLVNLVRCYYMQYILIFYIYTCVEGLFWLTSVLQTENLTVGSE